MNKKPTVTIAVSAYNEEHNIGSFLKSVIAQNINNYILESILVISDGSTDNTCNIVHSFHNPIIKLIEYKERKGKSERLNYIYQTINSDILIQSDADVVFIDKDLVSKIVYPIIRNEKVGMSGGNPIPLKGKTFTEKSINISTEAYSEFRQKVRNGNNIFSADGRLLAFRKEIYKKLSIPRDMIANDMFAFFCTIKRGFLYKYVPSAIVKYRSPTNLKDHIKQNTRFIASPIRMKRYFSKHLVKNELYISLIFRIKIYIKYFIRHPVYCIYILIINTYCKINASRYESKRYRFWQIANSTKSLNNIIN
jgi:poly-beta-1,6-N-acetyl-D-glucosamine synthase